MRFLGTWRKEWTVPTSSAISQARRHLGPEPLKLMFERGGDAVCPAGYARGVALTMQAAEVVPPSPRWRFRPARRGRS
ncbi:transposase domain-containing protein [Streptomyces sp.]|uniref:transposase domain-containing protein n=1 Tax=Streptomyces sp. TaxID=1931 RepID=UPI0039C9E23F